MEVIQQTNRTILFEEINPEKLDIITMIGDTKGIDSLDDDKIKEINEALLVRSFDEFLGKFAPVVYSFYIKKPENLSSLILRLKSEIYKSH